MAHYNINSKEKKRKRKKRKQKSKETIELKDDHHVDDSDFIKLA